ncbi:hypothetical protein BGX38DRAFT_1267964 [Terfezia claveryi]|nr:hypothetical protein BGX38DRAFT_1267964 [Terfezia claveryi]
MLEVDDPEDPEEAILMSSNIQAFVAPEDEEIVDNEEDLEEKILATYQTVPDEDSDDDGWNT